MAHVRSARYAEAPHKLVVFKGLLLAPATTLTEAGIRDGAVLHLLLNDSPYKGKRIYIKNAFAGTRVVECGPDFYIAGTHFILQHALLVKKFKY